MRKLSETTSTSIRASSIVPSFHGVAEELILNSIDANARNIEIHVNICDLSIKVKDDGDGIIPEDLRDRVGEWSHTSKPMSSHYGMKGEALASIRCLSDLEIYSARYPDSGFVKTMVNGEIVKNCKFKIHNEHKIGTVVNVTNLFRKMTVRAKTIKPKLELNLIKEFIRKISVLNHKISWTLVDNTSGVNKPILTLSSHTSVSKSFSFLHGDRIFENMKAVSHSFNQFTIVGFLSPPVNSHCHWTKEFQYSYVNKRWLRNSDLLAIMLNQLYSRLLSSYGSSGLVTKHLDLSGNTPRHPCFVLQLLCDPVEYEVLSEPDKSVAFFRDSTSLRKCVFSLVYELVEHYDPGLLPTLENQRSFYFSSENTLTHPWSDPFVTKEVEKVKPLEEQEPEEEQIPLPVFSVHSMELLGCGNGKNLEVSTEPTLRNLKPVRSPLFLSVFDFNSSPGTTSSPSTSSTIGSSTDDSDTYNTKKRKFQNESSYFGVKKTDKRDILPAGKQNLNRLWETEIGVQVNRLPNPFDKELENDEKTTSFTSSWVDEQEIKSTESSLWSWEQDFVNFKPIVKTDEISGFHGEIVQNSETEHSRESEFRVNTSDFFVDESLSQVFNGSSVGNNESITLNSNEENDHDKDFFNRDQGSRQKAFEVSDKFRHSGVKIMTDSFVINKDMLNRLEFIGQCDEKFLLVYEKKSNCLMALDQHAADERVNLEMFENSLYRDKLRQTRLCPIQSTQISKQIVSVLVDKANLFSSWNFDFSVIDDSNLFIDRSDTRCSQGQDGLKSEVENIFCSLHLLQVPVILDEPLMMDDFLEFIHYVSENFDLPERILKPPAVNRILNSRACKKAIKFGDILSDEKCRDILMKLSKTNLPFQCAHGRPSIAPLLNLKRNMEDRKVIRKRPNFRNFVHTIEKLVG